MRRIEFTLAAIGVAILAGVWAIWGAHASGCGGPGCRTAYRLVTWEQARELKRRLGPAALLVDIRSRDKESFPPSVDRVDIRFVDQDAEQVGLMTFRPSFTDEVDEQLRAARLTHASPMILFCDDVRCGELAATLLDEHGCEELYVVSTPSPSM